MTRKEFQEKHRNVVGMMARAQNVDVGVATDMLINHANQRRALLAQVRYQFRESEKVDFSEIYKDVDAVEAAAREKAGI